MVCEVDGKKLKPCASLAAALEYGNPNGKAKGMFLPERVNIKTGERGTDIVQIHSGNFIPKGIAVEYCPFCGTRIACWEAS